MTTCYIVKGHFVQDYVAECDFSLSVTAPVLHVRNHFFSGSAYSDGIRTAAELGSHVYPVGGSARKYPVFVRRSGASDFKLYMSLTAMLGGVTDVSGKLDATVSYYRDGEASPRITHTNKAMGREVLFGKELLSVPFLTGDAFTQLGSGSHRLRIVLTVSHAVSEDLRVAVNMDDMELYLVDPSEIVPSVSISNVSTDTHILKGGGPWALEGAFTMTLTTPEYGFYGGVEPGPSTFKVLTGDIVEPSYPPSSGGGDYSSSAFMSPTTAGVNDVDLSGVLVKGTWSRSLGISVLSSVRTWDSVDKMDLLLYSDRYDWNRKAIARDLFIAKAYRQTTGTLSTHDGRSQYTDADNAGKYTVSMVCTITDLGSDAYTNVRVYRLDGGGRKLMGGGALSSGGHTLSVSQNTGTSYSYEAVFFGGGVAESEGYRTSHLSVTILSANKYPDVRLTGGTLEAVVGGEEVNYRKYDAYPVPAEGERETVDMEFTIQDVTADMSAMVYGLLLRDRSGAYVPVAVDGSFSGIENGYGYGPDLSPEKYKDERSGDTRVVGYRLRFQPGFVHEALFRVDDMFIADRKVFDVYVSAPILYPQRDYDNEGSVDYHTPLVRAHVTEAGRSAIAMGDFRIAYYRVGDSQVDYGMPMSAVTDMGTCGEWLVWPLKDNHADSGRRRVTISKPRVLPVTRQAVYRGEDVSPTAPVKYWDAYGRYLFDDDHVLVDSVSDSWRMTDIPFPVPGYGRPGDGVHSEWVRAMYARDCRTLLRWDDRGSFSNMTAESLSPDGFSLEYDGVVSSFRTRPGEDAPSALRLYGGEGDVLLVTGDGARYPGSVRLVAEPGGRDMGWLCPGLKTVGITDREAALANAIYMATGKRQAYLKPLAAVLEPSRRSGLFSADQLSGKDLWVTYVLNGFRVCMNMVNVTESPDMCMSGTYGIAVTPPDMLYDADLNGDGSKWTEYRIMYSLTERGAQPETWTVFDEAIPLGSKGPFRYDINSGKGTFTPSASVSDTPFMAAISAGPQYNGQDAPMRGFTLSYGIAGGIYRMTIPVVLTPGSFTLSGNPTYRSGDVSVSELVFYSEDDVALMVAYPRYAVRKPSDDNLVFIVEMDF